MIVSNPKENPHPLKKKKKKKKEKKELEVLTSLKKSPKVRYIHNTKFLKIFHFFSHLAYSQLPSIFHLYSQKCPKLSFETEGLPSLFSLNSLASLADPWFPPRRSSLLLVIMTKQTFLPSCGLSTPTFITTISMLGSVKDDRREERP